MRMNLDTVLKRIPGKVICVLGEEKNEYASGNEAFEVYGETGASMYGSYYVVESIMADGDAVVLNVKDIRPELDKQNEEYEREHFEKFGRYPNRFDGA